MLTALLSESEMRLSDETMEIILDKVYNLIMEPYKLASTVVLLTFFLLF